MKFLNPMSLILLMLMLMWIIEIIKIRFFLLALKLETFPILEKFPFQSLG